MARAYRSVGGLPRDVRPEAAARPLRTISGWISCTPETPWGVHGRIAADRCTRCGWKA